MNKEKDYLLLSHLRANARNSLTRISRNTRIPVSTIFDKLKEFEDTIIKKHTALLDFKKLGFDLKAHLLFRVAEEQKETFKQFLLAHKAINSIYRINNGYDFLVEAIFSNLKELDEFYQQAQTKGSVDRQEFFIMEDLARERFLSYQPGKKTVFDST